jgi:hypothetical protein
LGGYHTPVPDKLARINTILSEALSFGEVLHDLPYLMGHEGLLLVEEELDKQRWQAQEVQDMHFDFGAI